MNKVNRKFLTAMGGGIITSLALPIVAPYATIKIKKKLEKRTRIKTLLTQSHLITLIVLTIAVVKVTRVKMQITQIQIVIQM
ncbi:hypothetical protein HYD43_00820 [Mycoplasmopsis bovis]|nr:hypothetical protein [Mycoplasmopsis bovis]QQH24998.1 hypothetical protein HYE18_00860 [Mycoplasmopsis bovis]QQH26782.1 hypothetical protein HYE09_00860 [Mycoplasmopsis bovis]QQH27001.1 hypothetical protein HYE08_00850 [Mycoplasmopsis bovis]QQH42508.1 hypothetical protein HYD81_00840 [Mycoplasmopsis bovis]QQH83918.1 hypothetical protein HYD43_00820 [Mycoplasmopsis bovis]